MIKSERGFTIVELMIATAVFSMVLLMCAFAIIHVGRMYYKGMIMNRTQDVSRSVADDISRAIQFGASGDNFIRTGTGSFPNSGPVHALCLGGVRYTYSATMPLGPELPGSIPHVLWKDRIPLGGDCDPLDITKDNPGGVEGAELLSENMRIPHLRVAQNGHAWDISIRVAHGKEVDLFEDGDQFTICKGANAGGQFCAVSSFKTTVTKRL